MSIGRTAIRMIDEVTMLTSGTIFLGSVASGGGGGGRRV